MGTQQHIIMRQVLEVELPSVDNAWQMQNRISDLYKQELVPVLEEVFDSLCGPGEVIRIDKLEIDLGDMRIETFEEEVREKMNAYINEVFTPAVKRAKQEGTALLNGTFIKKEEQKLPPGEKEMKITSQPRYLSETGLVNWFLQTGTLPWWYDKETFGSITQLLARFIEDASPYFIEKLPELIRIPDVRKRLVYTLLPLQLEKVLRLFAQNASAIHLPAYLELIAKSETYFQSTNASATLQLQLWEAALQHIVLNDVRPAQKFLEQHPLLPIAELPLSIKKLVESFALPLSENELTERVSETENVLAKEKEDAIQAVEEEDLADFYISNAGLVLVWNFLQPFFAELGLTTDKKFTDEAAAHRAVHLLQYLTAGSNKYEEQDLVLNKILCGLEITEPVNMAFTITEKEKEECENLLQTVIDNWKAIGRTSVDGFRNTFLQKEGALKKAENGWSLYIERKTVDMLLERLPWSFSIVKLPWSREMIYTEW